MLLRIGGLAAMSKSLERALLLAFRGKSATFCLGGELDRSARPHTLAQWNFNRITAIHATTSPDAGPRVRLRDRLA